MRGLVHIYCGDGKGKTTAAAGLAVRAAGNGFRVLFLQFMKNGRTGELASFEKLENITVQQGEKTAKFSWNMDEYEKQDVAKTQQDHFDEAAKKACEYDMLVLDEAVGACFGGFLSEEKLCAFLDQKPETLEVVMTGRNPSQRLLDRADYVSEIKKIKHPYDQGICARKGIEQ